MFSVPGRQVANPPVIVSEVLPHVTNGLRSNDDISPIGIFARPCFELEKHLLIWSPANSSTPTKAGDASWTFHDADVVRIAARLVYPSNGYDLGTGGL
ncbi:hypothetical protein ELG83_04125 [Rhizobium leguminosarum]|uniref:Uncharacterized protein n=1 Tax=Rhizobium leguminosarum bv. viciae TaxID=387 RepID=A0A8G2MSW7_RHILV|nr:hypothetical protein [Rhizobium leguminosarum bv. viciae]TBF38376.1 hypothetical protein ELG88_04120 [Rhizobium leguminosarum]NKK23310.1 hypothetical protein [Rhizobium leguminosarum bv. viciae]TBF43188.1 hypothetical protein ELG92_04120 [Rhizobium leguminosarum]TBF54763.1 hypothetical protein ELG91_04190 [Rhizobium leguminosarum]